MVPALLLLVLSWSIGGGLGACPACNINSQENRFAEIFYSSSDEHIENPGRGFYQYSLTRASSFSPLTISYLETQRRNEGVTVIWRQYVLDTFVSSDISSSFLNSVRDDMQTLRDGGCTAVLRFMYTTTSTDGPPYGDATKAWMETHISQVGPVLNEYQDVISILHAGFVGIWGEWYYTTYLGDPNDRDWSNPDCFRGHCPQVWADRGDIQDALLAAAPPSMTIQFRYPTLKYYILSDDTPASEQDMEQQNDKGRIGHHNDCFVSSDNDVGTYWNKEVEYPYLQGDTQWTSNTGESCRLHERNDCSIATKELAELHFTSLNQAYNRDVLQVWKDQGCYNEIHRRLGYRLQLNRAVLPDSLDRGGQFCFLLEFENDGYAAPLRDRDLAIMLRHVDSGTLYEGIVPDINIRRWVPESSHIVESSVNIPSGLPGGSYQILVALKDPDLSDLSDYNILLANRDVPEYREGLNSLLHTISAGSGSGSNPDCPTFSEVSPQQESNYDRLFCGYGGC